MKKRCGELSQSLADMMAEVLEIAQTPVDDATLPQAQLFGRLDAGLARSRWTEKVRRDHCQRSHLSTKSWICTHIKKRLHFSDRNFKKISPQKRKKKKVREKKCCRHFKLITFMKATV